MAKRKTGSKTRQKGFVVDKPKKHHSPKKDWFGAKTNMEH